MHGQGRQGLTSQLTYTDNPTARYQLPTNRPHPKSLVSLLVLRSSYKARILSWWQPSSMLSAC